MTINPLAGSQTPLDPGQAAGLQQLPQLQTGLAPPQQPTPAQQLQPQNPSWSNAVMNPGGISAVKQLASGFLALPEMALHPEKGIPEFLKGTAAGLWSVVDTATLGLGDVGNSTIKGLTGIQPDDVINQARHEGIIRAVVNQLATVAMVAAPVAGVAEGAGMAAAAGAAAATDVASGASDAEDAAQAASEAASGTAEGFHPFRSLGANRVAEEFGQATGTPEEIAAQLQARSQEIAQEGGVAHAFAHPYGYIASQFAKLTDAAAAAQAPATAVEAAEQPESAVDIAARKAAEGSVVPGEAPATEVAPTASPAAQEQEAIVAGIKSVQNVQTGAAQALGTDEERAPETEQEPPVGSGAKLQPPARPGAAVPEGAAEEDMQDLRTAEEKAKATARQSTVAAEMLRRIQQTPPAWATRLVEVLPDSVNGVLAKFNIPIQKSRIHAVARDYARFAEASQRAGQTSSAVKLSVQAATDLLAHRTDLGGMTEDDASTIIGEELRARMNGRAMVAEFIRGGGDPEIAEALRVQARGGLVGVTDEMRAALSPEENAALESHLHDAEVAWEQQARVRYNTLLASRYGAQGIEGSVLGDEKVPLTPAQVKLYRQIMTNERTIAALKARIPEEQMKREAEAQRLSFIADAKAAEADEAVTKLGVQQRSMESLQYATPRSLKDEATEEAAIDDQIGRVRDEGGSTWDVGRNQGVHLDEGYEVSVAPQFDLPLVSTADEQGFDVLGHDAIRDAMEHPHDMNGDPTGPGVWAGPLRLGVWAYEDENGVQRVAGDLSLSTWGDKPLERWQAIMIGKAFRQQEVYSWTDGEGNIALDTDAGSQDLAANYLDQVVNPKSDLARVAGELQAIQDRVGPHLSDGDLDGMLRFLTTLDYGESRTNPAAMSLGDLFRQIRFEYGLKPGETEGLYQTVTNEDSWSSWLRANDPEDISHLDIQTLSDALAWYYDSHDYIESMYRYNSDGSVKMLQLLDGSYRPAADVFYDLIAVTSVMADPATNLGRALMGMANIEDFMATHEDAMAAAQDLMDQLEAMPGDIKYVKNIGQPGEDISDAKDGGGTPLSERFLTPAVRKITDHVSMTNKPKYNVFDILTGKLKLDDANATDLEQRAEWWGSGKSISPANMPRANVLDAAERLGLQGPAVDAYRTWAVERDGLAALAGRIDALRDANPGVKINTIYGDVFNGTGFRTLADLTRAIKANKEAEAALLEDPAVAKAFDEALMEFQGSSAFAKLRSFRANLADPAHSLHVTMDSVMAHMHGFVSTQWNKTGGYAYGANDVRDAAQMATDATGQDIRPHQMQAVNWVWTKKEIGRLDWGRLLAHHDLAQTSLDGFPRWTPAQIAGFDPYGDYWGEELGYPRFVDDIRNQITDLKAEIKRNPSNWSATAKLMRLQQYDLTGQSSEVFTTADRENVRDIPSDTGAYRWETRHEITEGGELTEKEKQFADYVKLRERWRQLLADGQVDQVRREVTSWAVTRKDSVLGPTGGSFMHEGERLLSQDDNATVRAMARLKNAVHTPPPTQWSHGFISNLAARFNREHGLAAPHPIDTTVLISPARTKDVANAVVDWIDRRSRGEITPEEDAVMAQSYRVLQQLVAQQYDYMTNTLGVRVDYVSPDQEYGIGSLGDDPQPDVARAHAELVRDVRENNHIKIRGTEAAGDGPNQYMAERDPNTGLLFNDELRAVHDFFGHAQAANDFSRYGENIAMLLHMQMFPEDAWPALVSEFRAQTAYLVDQGHFLDSQDAPLLPDAMRQPDFMIRGDGDQLDQRFNDQVRGATLEPRDASGRLTVRLYKNAALDTLVHESLHVLRRILPQDEQELFEREYPHITDAPDALGRISDVRRAAEEKFVGDIMFWMRQHQTSTWQDYVSPAMGPIFQRVAAILEEQHAAVLDSATGRGLTPDIAAWASRLFNPQIERPDQVTDPISANSMHLNGVETKQFPYETPSEFAQRSRLYGEARVKTAQARSDAANAQRIAAKASAAAAKMWAQFNSTPGEIAQQAAKLQVTTDAMIAKLAAQLEDPKTGQVPMPWREMWAGIQELHAAALADKTGQIAGMLDEIPDTFSAMLQYAAERGFDPTHIPDITQEQAQRMLFGHIQLGAHGDIGTATRAGTRLENKGILKMNRLEANSIEALAGGFSDSTELYGGMLVDWIERAYAQPVPDNGIIPKGWHAWGPERSYILTGVRDNGERIAPGASLMIPDAVHGAIKSMSQQFDHWSFHMTSRFMRPYKLVTMGMSPKFYLHIFISNVVRGLAEGVSLHDATTAINQWKEGTIPSEVAGLTSLSTDAETHAKSLIPRTLSQTRDAAGNAAALKEVMTRMQRVHHTIDQISRAAVFEHTLRTTGSRDAALTRASIAMGDYGDLSPMERALTRSVVPFYPFHKAMLKLLLHYPTDHPLAASLLLQLGAVHEEQVEDRLHGPIPENYEGLANIFGWHNDKILDPFFSGVTLTDPRQIKSIINPFIDIFIREAYSAPAPGTAEMGLSDAGAPSPQVNLRKAVEQKFTNIPAAGFIHSVLTGKNQYGQKTSPGSALGTFTGVPPAVNVNQLGAKENEITQTQAGALEAAGVKAKESPQLRAAAEARSRAKRGRVVRPAKPKAIRIKGMRTEGAFGKMHAPRIHEAKVRAGRVRISRGAHAHREELHKISMRKPKSLHESRGHGPKVGNAKALKFEKHSVGQEKEREQTQRIAREGRQEQARAAALPRLKAGRKRVTLAERREKEAGRKRKPPVT